MRSSLPVPKPLAEAIAAAHFGRDEEGRPIRPSPQEVRAITASHADAMAEALQGGQRDAFENGISQYAESFGAEAAQRLRSYAQRLARDSGAAIGRR